MNPYDKLVRTLPKGVILAFTMEEPGGFKLPSGGQTGIFALVVVVAVLLWGLAAATTLIPHGAPPTMAFTFPGMLATILATAMCVRFPKTKHKAGRIGSSNRALLMEGHTCNTLDNLAIALETDADHAAALLSEAAVLAVQAIDAEHEQQRKRDELLTTATDRIEAMLETNKDLKLLATGTGGKRERETT